MLEDFKGNFEDRLPVTVWGRTDLAAVNDALYFDPELNGSFFDGRLDEVHHLAKNDTVLLLVEKLKSDPPINRKYELKGDYTTTEGCVTSLLRVINNYVFGVISFNKPYNEGKQSYEEFMKHIDSVNENGIMDGEENQ